MRALVALVTIMSLLIVAGLGLFAYGMVTRIAPDKMIEHKALALPQGSRINQLTGYKGGIALYVTAKGGDHLYFVNPSSGKITAHMPITMDAIPADAVPAKP